MSLSANKASEDGPCNSSSINLSSPSSVYKSWPDASTGRIHQNRVRSEITSWNEGAALEVPVAGRISDLPYMSASITIFQRCWWRNTCEEKHRSLSHEALVVLLSLTWSKTNIKLQKYSVLISILGLFQSKIFLVT